MKLTTASLLTAVAAGATTVAAQALTPGELIQMGLLFVSGECRSTLGSFVADGSPTAECLKPNLIWAAANSNSSLIPGIENYLNETCSTAPCSNSTISDVAHALATNCSSDLAKFGTTPEQVLHILELYPMAREILCLKTTNPFNGTLIQPSNATTTTNGSTTNGSTPSIMLPTAPVSSMSVMLPTAIASGGPSVVSSVASAASSGPALGARQDSQQPTVGPASSAIQPAMSSAASAVMGTPSAPAPDAAATPAPINNSTVGGNSTVTGNSTVVGNSTGNATEPEYCAVSLLENLQAYMGNNLTFPYVQQVALGGNSTAWQTLKAIPLENICNDCIVGAVTIMNQAAPWLANLTVARNGTDAISLVTWYQHKCNVTLSATNATLPEGIMPGANGSTYGFPLTYMNGTSGNVTTVVANNTVPISMNGTDSNSNSTDSGAVSPPTAPISTLGDVTSTVAPLTTVPVASGEASQIPAPTPTDSVAATPTVAQRKRAIREFGHL